MHEVYFVMFVTQMKKPWNVEMQKKQREANISLVSATAPLVLS